MASIQKRGSTYRARVIRRGYPTQSKTFNTKVEAVKWARNIEAKIDEGLCESNKTLSIHIVGRSMPFSDAANQYVGTHSIRKKNYKSEAGIFKILSKRWEDKTVFEVNKHEVISLRDELVTLGRAGDTINHYFSAISKLYQMLADELSIDISNPIKAIRRMPANPGRSVRLTGKAEELFINCCKKTKPKDLADLVRLAIETGMRRGELLGIRWSDIDLEYRRIYLHTTKNGEARQVPLTLKALQIIKDISQREPQSEMLFTCSTPSLRKGFERARKMAKSIWANPDKNPFNDLRLHDTRHEALSRLSDAGLNTIELAHISGHKTMACLRRYTHPSHDAIFTKLDKSTSNK